MFRFVVQALQHGAVCNEIITGSLILRLTTVVLVGFKLCFG